MLLTTSPALMSALRFVALDNCCAFMRPDPAAQDLMLATKEKNEATKARSHTSPALRIEQAFCPTAYRVYPPAEGRLATSVWCR